jgi:hypothetical protein
MEPPHLEQVKKWHQRFLNTGSIMNDNNGNNEHWTGIDEDQQQQHSQQQDLQKNTSQSFVDTFGLETEEQIKISSAGLR